MGGRCEVEGVCASAGGVLAAANEECEDRCMYVYARVDDVGFHQAGTGKMTPFFPLNPIYS
jgi:hypothetical protein